MTQKDAKTRRQVPTAKRKLQKMTQKSHFLFFLALSCLPWLKSPSLNSYPTDRVVEQVIETQQTRAG